MDYKHELSIQRRQEDIIILMPYNDSIFLLNYFWLHRSFLFFLFCTTYYKGMLAYFDISSKTKDTNTPNEAMGFGKAPKRLG